MFSFFILHYLALHPKTRKKYITRNIFFLIILIGLSKTKLHQILSTDNASMTDMI